MKATETPLMKQYQEMKKKHPDAILLFRIGDFYETFSEDAITASEILGITLTRRANGSASYVELAGFPHHALDTYLPKLIRAGKRVAICEQLEDPKFTKKLVMRQPTEIITPYKRSVNANICCLFLTLMTFGDIINKLSIFEEIRCKTLEIRSLASALCVSPKKAFEECSKPIQPSLFD